MAMTKKGSKSQCKKNGCLQDTLRVQDAPLVLMAADLVPSVSVPSRVLCCVDECSCCRGHPTGKFMSQHRLRKE